MNRLESRLLGVADRYIHHQVCLGVEVGRIGGIRMNRVKSRLLELANRYIYHQVCLGVEEGRCDECVYGIPSVDEYDCIDCMYVAIAESIAYERNFRDKYK